MKKAKINEFPLPSFGGELIGYAISKYHGSILCKPVHKRRVKQTPRQKEAQERFKQAAWYAKRAMEHPEIRKAYEARLPKKNGSLYTAIFTDYLQNGEPVIDNCKRSKSSRGTR